MTRCHPAPIVTRKGFAGNQDPGSIPSGMGDLPLWPCSASRHHAQLRIHQAVVHFTGGENTPGILDSTKFQHLLGIAECSSVWNPRLGQPLSTECPSLDTIRLATTQVSPVVLKAGRTTLKREDRASCSQMRRVGGVRSFSSWICLLLHPIFDCVGSTQGG